MFLKKLKIEVVENWRDALSNKYYFLSLIGGVLFFIFGLYLNNISSVYNDSAGAYLSVGDFILNRIETYNLEFFYAWGMYLTIVLIVIFSFLFKPTKGPFIFKTFGLLYVVRAFFILLTHVGPPVGFFYDQSIPGAMVASKFLFRNDLFFSGHVAVPFIAFLIFKGTKFRWFFFVMAVLMTITVLFMHIHYSIDVFAAYFIAHSVYVFSDMISDFFSIKTMKKIKAEIKV
ncbi:MAG: phosphatase PAP2-related protein [Candidatus Peregrinibacteria bacterium]|nr:phosphatase PAP2-related protein [Candidatus Peregrinibacteria bacterium]